MKARWVAASLGLFAALLFAAGAQAVHDLGFQLDGDVSASTTTNVGGSPQIFDWDSFFNASGQSSPVLPSASRPGFTNSDFTRDFESGASCTLTAPTGPFCSHDGSTFTTGSKDTLNISSGWQCASSNNVGGKVDIMNVYALSYTAPNGHQLLYFALERNDNSGAGNVAFWFLQGQASCDTSNGTASWTGDHSDGDLLVVSEFTQGGSVSTVNVFRWMGGANGTLNTNPVAAGADCKITAGNDTACATVNSPANGTGGTITTPWLTANKNDGAGHALRTSEFYEGGLDLTSSNLSGKCFSTFIGDTRSSPSPTATIFDYAQGSFQHCGANIQINPPTATNEVGQQHTFTVTVTKTDPTGATVPAPGVHPAVTLTASNGATVTLITDNCGASGPGTDANGQCTVIFTSSGAGKVTGHASATVPVDGQTFFVETDGDTKPDSGNSGNAVKTFVDAKVSLSPLTATNAVGQSHTITLTLLKNAGDGAGFVAAANETCTVTLTASGGATPNPAGPFTVTTNTSGQASVTYTSATAGQVTAHASCTVHVGGLTLTRASDGSHGSTGDAVKTFVDASISITPNTATNAVGNQHVFTITVTAIPAGATPVSFGAITTSVSPAPTSQSTTCGSPTISGNTATCTLTINSSSAGTFTANASAQVTMGGVTVTRSTSGNSGPGGSGPATKRFVDASISITPNTATNEVGNQHVFTITVTAIPSGATPVVFGAITTSVSPAPTSQSTTCGSPTISGNTATCTLTINSSSAGTFTANASAQLTMGGVTVTRSTSGNSGPGGSGPATKRFVDASISITPNTATNEVGNQHVFTITVTAIPSGATPVVFGAITTSVSPAPTSQSTTCGSPTVNGNTATCTLTINSSSAGTFTANASAQLTIGGVALTRSTSGNSGPGGSGPATKRFVDASISITPQTAVNEVGNQHVFTITVTAIPSGAIPVVFGAITTSVSPAPTSQSTTCGLPTVSGNTATCTLTINSSSAGTFTANASASVTMGGVTVTRSTSGNSGPGGSGPATKRFVDASISITPNTATNEVGNQHVFTITVTAIPAGATPVVFGAITTSVSPAPTSQSTTCNAPTISGNTATCTLTINSSSAGTFTANASAQLTIGGVALTRSTSGNSGPGGSGPATKRFVDASISITPNTATNEVGNQHVFTITVTAIPSGATPVVFGAITTSVSPAPTSQSTTCGSPTVSGNTATCTLTINSSSAGTFTANASASVTMGGVTVTRSTSGNSGPGGSGPATKRFVDASISITPNTATNEVRNQHVFTITVTAIPSGATPVVFGAITTSVSPAPTSQSTTCGSPTVSGNTATCTLTINNATAGTFTANASAQLTIGGVALTRSTSGNSGPGGSGPATKRFVDARISLSPLTATNPVRQAHTITATVEQNDGLPAGAPGDGASGFGPAPNGTVVTFSLLNNSANASFVAGNTCTISNGAGTCTIQINSNSAGGVDIHATTTFSVGGVSLTRATGDGLPGDSADAHKDYIPSPSTTTTHPQQNGQNVTSIAFGESVRDHAVVAGNAIAGPPTGTVAFSICSPSQLDAAGTCSSGGTAVSTNGLTAIPGTNSSQTDSASFTPDQVGKWCFRGVYSGDSAYLGSSDSSAGECFTVGQRASKTQTQQSVLISDFAKPMGFGTPTGTVTFSLFTNATCSGTPIFGPITKTLPQDAVNGIVHVDNPTALTANGTYYWLVSYSGDVNNLPSTSLCGDEQTTISGNTPGIAP